MPGQLGQGQKGTYTFYIVLKVNSLPSSTGRKQDTWFVVDPESGETHMTLTTEGLSTPQLYIGRTRKSDVPMFSEIPSFSLPRPDSCYPC